MTKEMSLLHFLRKSKEHTNRQLKQACFNTGLFSTLEPVKNYDNGEYERFLAACFSDFSARTRRVRPSK